MTFLADCTAQLHRKVFIFPVLCFPDMAPDPIIEARAAGLLIVESAGPRPRLSHQGHCPKRLAERYEFSAA